ncbi:hypothetical protein QZH41_014090, partial [Actinostola sp. cb2023]
PSRLIVLCCDVTRPLLGFVAIDVPCKMAIVEKAFGFLVNAYRTSNYAVLIAILLGILVPLVVYRIRRYLASKGPNPFLVDTRRPPEPIIFDQAERDRIIKQGFSAKKIPDNLDAIVIGSGIGGMTCACLLARSGKKVLVLEQHDQAGGCCHTFHDKGFEFDTGIHYIGEMQNRTATKFVIDQLTDGQLLWSPLERQYDTVAIGDLSNAKIYPIMSGREEFRKALHEKFPDEKVAIDKYLELLKKMRKSIMSYFILKSLPQFLGRLLVSTGLVHLITDYFKMARRTLTEVLDELTDNKDLKTVLAYCFGDYGTIPKEASFAMHALLVNHFMNGSSYPKGGASEIALHLTQALEKMGSAVMVRAKVTQILLDENAGHAKGVRVSKSSGDIDILAPLVVSGAGFYNTYAKLLPQSVSPLKNIMKSTKGIKHGIGAMSVYIGLKGSKKDLGIKASNVWAFTNNEVDKITEEFLKMNPEEAGNEDIPLLFISFPSTKDPEWEKRFPDKSTCTIVSFAPFEWFQQWEDKRVMKRGEDYEELKHRIGRRMWEQTCRHFPQLKDKEEFFDVGSPLSNQYYIASPRGEIYGLDHNKDRFSPETCVNLRPNTTIPGLYLTGQDVLTCGFAGAMFGALFTASSILQRNVMFDMMSLRKKVKQDPPANNGVQNGDLNINN